MPYSWARAITAIASSSLSEVTVHPRTSAQGAVVAFIERGGGEGAAERQPIERAAMRARSDAGRVMAGAMITGWPRPRRAPMTASDRGGFARRDRWRSAEGRAAPRLPAGRRAETCDRGGARTR